MTNELPLTALGRVSHDVAQLTGVVGTLASVVNTERQTRRRFRVNIVALFILAAGNILGLTFAYRAANDAKKVANTLEDCLIPGGACAGRLAEQGKTGLVKQMDFQICWANTPAEQRSESLLERCKEDVLKDVVADSDIKEVPK